MEDIEAMEERLAEITIEIAAIKEIIEAGRETFNHFLQLCCEVNCLNDERQSIEDKIEELS